jgi:hypothetical protein
MEEIYHEKLNKEEIVSFLKENIRNDFTINEFDWE